MNRERGLKIALVLVGLLFLAGVYPLTMFLSREPALAMMLSLYVTLGIFLLLGARNPSANRSLIAFTAWSSFAHAAVMAGGANPKKIQSGERLGGALVVVFWVGPQLSAPPHTPGRRAPPAAPPAPPL